MPTSQTDTEDPTAAGSVGEQPPSPASASNRIVPDAVSRRFLRIDDRYFFPDRTLAFVDTGTRLKVRTHNLEVVHSIVAIMQARGWQTVALKGTHEFRQKVWHEATLQGIGVRGYEPSAVEMQQLQRALNRDQAIHQRRAAPDGRPAPGPPSTEERRAPRGGLRPPTVGVLLAHAAAPYQFDPMQRMSYYARIQTEVGERTLWGADLERAMVESRSGVRVGDEVVLSQRGARPVTVRVPDRNAEGALVGDKKHIAQRMTWRVEKTEYIESLDRKAALLRNGAVAADAVLSQYPDLAGAVAGMRLAEQFAQRLTPRADDQARVVHAIRSRIADAIAQGQEVKLPPQRVRQAHVHHRGRSAPTLEDPGHSRA